MAYFLVLLSTAFFLASLYIAFVLISLNATGNWMFFGAAVVNLVKRSYSVERGEWRLED